MSAGRHRHTRRGRFVGQSVTRREDPRLLTGHGTYVDDVVVPGMLHAAFVRSDLARARITRIDVEAARALDGCHAVLTAADLNPGLGSFQPTMFQGEHAAVAVRAAACCSPTATSASSVIPSRSWSPRAATSPRTRASSSRSTTSRSSRSSIPKLAARDERARPPRARLERRDVHPHAPRSRARRRLRHRRARRAASGSSSTGTRTCRWRRVA